MSRKLTPREVGERLGVSAETVIGWIRSGELRGVNVSASIRSRRPRYRVAEADLESFERARSVVPAASRRRRRSGPRPGVIQFVA